MRNPLLLLALTATSTALTFTSPLPGSTIDLTTPLTITWIPSASDPSTFTLSIVNTLSGSSTPHQTLATNLHTSSTSYTLPPNSISSYGDGFEFLAAAPQGSSLAYSGAFSLADGGSYTLQTASDGALTIVTSSTQLGGPVATSAPATSSVATSSSEAASKTVMSTKSSTATPKSSTAHASSTRATSTARSSSTLTTSINAAAATSSSSDPNSNLGFGSAASVVRGSGVVSCAAFVGAAVFTLLVC